MPTTYTIIFNNEHGSDGKYCFCTEKPIVSGNVKSESVFTNIWIAKFVPAGNDFTIKTEATYYAWCGKLESKPAEGVTFLEGHSEPVALGSTKNDGDALKMILNQGSPTFDKAKAKTAKAGCFSISQGKDFKEDDNVAIGIAQKDNIGHKTPAAVILADQNMETNIQPVVKFYVKKYDSKVGTIINYQSFSVEAGVIDFTEGPGQGHYTASVTHKPDGGWDVKYFD